MYRTSKAYENQQRRLILDDRSKKLEKSTINFYDTNLTKASHSARIISVDDFKNLHKLYLKNHLIAKE